VDQSRSVFHGKCRNSWMMFVEAVWLMLYIKSVLIEWGWT